MTDYIKNIKLGVIPRSFLLSILFHFLIFLLVTYLINIQFDKPVINPVYLIFTKSNASVKSALEEKISDQKFNTEDFADEKTTGYYYFSATEYDTSKIKQVYKESTLNLSLRYPNGWIYLDQNVEDKLDGVTFWAAGNNHEIPPYVHLEVRDKDIFNPSRYKYKQEYNGNIYYYNEPMELEGYFTQLIYIRTGSDEDYSLKLTVKGKETFLAFQREFFSMVKSLRFGNSFF